MTFKCCLSLTILPPGTKFNSHWLWASLLWRCKTVISRVKFWSFIIPPYWPVTYKSLVRAGASVKLIALFCDLWLSAIWLRGLLSLLHQSVVSPTWVWRTEAAGTEWTRSLRSCVWPRPSRCPFSHQPQPDEGREGGWWGVGCCSITQ